MTYVWFEFTYVQVLAVASVLLMEVVLKEKKTSWSTWNIPQNGAETTTQ